MTTRVNKTYVLTSGGIDSAITLCYAAAITRSYHEDVSSVYVHNLSGSSEIEAAQFKAVSELQEMCRKQFGGLVNPLSLYAAPERVKGESNYLPYRNVELALLVARYAERHAHDLACTSYTTTILLGGLRDDRVEDKTPQSAEAISAALTVSGKIPVTFTSLLWGKSKAEAVREFLATYGEWGGAYLRRTTSCYKGKNCGMCQSCFRAYISLEYAGLSVADSYLTHPGLSKVAKKYSKEMRDNPDKFDPERVKSTLAVLEAVP